VPTYKGSYAESMTAAIAAFRAGNAPHIVQVFEVGTATMMAAKGAIVPVYQADEGRARSSTQGLCAAVAGYYTDRKGKMLSFPFNSSTVVFYINKDAFKKAGLDPEWRPRPGRSSRWPPASSRPAASKCVYTTGWPSWVHVENFSAWHNVPIGTKENGMGGWTPSSRSTRRCTWRHIEMLADMAKKGCSPTSRPRNEAEAKFFSGECAMLTSSARGAGQHQARTPSSLLGQLHAL
jgi:sn-glycerol 3-phosphate transport system substrate-binding protein